MDPKDIDIVILSGLTPQYDAEVRMLESSANWPTRERIKRAVINQYERLESEKSAAGGIERCCPPVATAATINTPSDTPVAPAQDTLPFNAVISRSTAVRRNRKDIRGIEKMAAGTAEVAEKTKAAKAAEWAATVEAEAV